MRASVAALVAFLVLLSGCSGSKPGGDDAPEGTFVEDIEGGGSDLGLAPLELPAGVPLAGAVAIDATFPVGDTCNANPARGCVERVHDLGAALPAGIPVEVAVDITWEAGDGVFHMEAWVDGDGMTWLRVDNTTLEDGHWRWTALVIPGAASRAVVISGGPQSAAQPNESPYHIDVAFTGSNQSVPGMVPVAAALGPNSTVQVRSPEGTEVAFILYGPRDEFVQEATGGLTLPMDAVAGDYIVMPRSRGLVLVPGGGELRFVGVAFTVSDEVPIPPGSSVTVEVSSPTPPFIAAAYYVSQQQTPAMFGVEFQFTLTDPDGTALVAEEACQPFCVGGFSAAWSTGLGKDLKEGTYTLSIASQAAHDSYAGAYLLTFDRSSL